MEKQLTFIRGVVRPSITWIGFIAYIFMIFLDIPVPEDFKTTIAVILGFWFGTREIGKKNTT